MTLLSTLFCALALGTAHAEESDLEFDLEGYYRTRGYVFKDLFQGPINGPAAGRPAGTGRYMLQRLRLQPVVKFEELASFTMMADVLDNVVWGDNMSRSSTALFAGDPTANGLEGTETASFNLKRAWMEFTIPVGKIRIGRQPSNWGMGLLANDGNGFDDTFGENHGGSTYDRFLFATRPLAIAQKIAGKPDSGTPLFFVLGVDRLVEDPLIQHYGYECTENPAGGGWVKGEHDAYDERCDLSSVTGETGRDGITDQVHGYTEDRDADYRSGDWWADNDDDVYQMIYALIYKGEDVPMFGTNGDFTLGVYSVNRKQIETKSNIWILDGYMSLLYRGLLLEGEIINIRGDSSAIAMPGAYDPTGDVEDKLRKEVDIWGWVGRAGYKQSDYSAIFEMGYASGDENPTDVAFTGRPLHPEYNVGLLFYEEIMSRVTAASWGEDARGLWSKGGVYNSRYIFPTLSYVPMEGWELIVGYLRAWPDKPDGANILCSSSDRIDGKKLDCAKYEAKDDHLAWEIDFGIHHRFHEHVLFALETGYAETSDRIPLDRAGLNSEGKFYTLQTRFAFEF